MKKVFLAVLTVVVSILSACNKNVGGNHAPALLTDSVSVSDTIVLGKSSAEVSVSGQYPASGYAGLLENSRKWLAECLSWGAYTTSKPLVHLTKADLANGSRLADHVCVKLLASAKRDFIFLAADSISIGYEYQIAFGPVFESDSLLTYSYSAYCYQGGAHGGMIAKVATFAVSDGHLLTYDNSFLPDRRRELVNLVKKALWSQYFAPSASNEGAPSSLREALLIDPDSLDLPISGPEFGPEGITFTYGQYEIAPYAAGMPECTISYATLRPLMRPETANLISRPEK